MPAPDFSSAFTGCGEIRDRQVDVGAGVAVAKACLLSIVYGTTKVVPDTKLGSHADAKAHTLQRLELFRSLFSPGGQAKRRA